MKASELLKRLKDGVYDLKLKELYNDVESAKKRYLSLIEKFIDKHGDNEISIFSAPGRSEIGGNHTDHQQGKVLACAIDLDIVAVVSFNKSMIVNVISEGFNIKPVDLNDLDIHQNEYGTSEGIIRGIAKCFKDKNLAISGFNAYIESQILKGSGLSTSAAFEALIGTIFSDGLNNGTVDPIENAKIGQYAENNYFNKPSGLMDQMACCLGGFVYIDFFKEPKVKQIDFDLSDYGYSLCIVDTRGSHENLTDEYTAIPSEMRAVSEYFGKKYLSEINIEEFINNISEIRKKTGDRAVLRSFHFLKENERVPLMAKALEEKDINLFFKYVNESGNSSYKYLQNVFANNKNQEIPLALSLCEYILGEDNVSRVHGGGFAGTIQAYVKNDKLVEFEKLMTSVFGEDSVYTLHIRKKCSFCLIK